MKLWIILPHRSSDPCTVWSFLVYLKIIYHLQLCSVYSNAEVQSSEEWDSIQAVILRGCKCVSPVTASVKHSQRSVASLASGLELGTACVSLASSFQFWTLAWLQCMEPSVRWQIQDTSWCMREFGSCLLMEPFMVVAAAAPAADRDSEFGRHILDHTHQTCSLITRSSHQMCCLQRLLCRRSTIGWIQGEADWTSCLFVGWWVQIQGQKTEWSGMRIYNSQFLPCALFDAPIPHTNFNFQLRSMIWKTKWKQNAQFIYFFYHPLPARKRLRGSGIAA